MSLPPDAAAAPPSASAAAAAEINPGSLPASGPSAVCTSGSSSVERPLWARAAASFPFFPASRVRTTAGAAVEGAAEGEGEGEGDEVDAEEAAAAAAIARGGALAAAASTTPTRRQRLVPRNAAPKEIPRFPSDRRDTLEIDLELLAPGIGEARPRRGARGADETIADAAIIASPLCFFF